MRNKKKRNPKDIEKFSVSGLCKHMIFPGIVGGIIGLLIPGDYPLLFTIMSALLGGIRYCDRFDELP